MKKVGVIGGSGYSGGELLRILARHPDVDITHTTSRRFKGKKVSELHPNLREVLDLKFLDVPSEEVGKTCDIVFTAVPHGAAMDIVPKVLKSRARVIDLSGDFRFKDLNLYERYYNMKHSHPEIKGIYGLSELYREMIKDTDLVANPGCYPTSSILALLPLIKENLIDHHFIVADAKSGVSGAGATLSEKTHFCSASESISAYGVTSHRHMPEIEEQLSKFGKGVKVSFVPHLVPLIRGISITLHCKITEQIAEEEVYDIFVDFYKDEPFIRVLDVGEVPRLSAVRGSNFNDIGCFKIDKERGMLIVVSACDNLVKGAAGQAVQNMNIMLGFKETSGLELIGIHP